MDIVAEMKRLEGQSIGSDDYALPFDYMLGFMPTDRLPHLVKLFDEFHADKTSLKEAAAELKERRAECVQLKAEVAATSETLAAQSARIAELTRELANTQSKVVQLQGELNARPEVDADAIYDRLLGLETLMRRVQGQPYDDGVSSIFETTEPEDSE